jgi:putative Holliday junction resolvase
MWVLSSFQKTRQGNSSNRSTLEFFYFQRFQSFTTTSLLTRFFKALAYNDAMVPEQSKNALQTPALSITKTPGRVLGIDYGRKRMGLALSDPLSLTAGPLMVFLRTNRQADMRRLRELCRRHEVRRIVIGYPLSMDGSKSEMAEEAARFAVRVKKNLGIPVELIDERLTSWEAAQISSSKQTSDRESNVDDIAAAIILREYLERQRGENSAALSAGEES